MVDSEAKRIVHRLPEVNLIGNDVWRYVRDLRSTGLVSGLLVGDSRDPRSAHFWHVFAGNISRLEGSTEPYRDLFDRVKEFKTEVSRVVPIRAIGVNPSRLDELIEDCEMRGLNVELLSF